MAADSAFLALGIFTGQFGERRNAMNDGPDLLTGT